MSEAFMPLGAGSIEVLCDRDDDCMDAEQRMEQLPSEYPEGHKCSQQSSSLKGDGYISQHLKPA